MAQSNSFFDTVRQTLVENSSVTTSDNARSDAHRYSEWAHKASIDAHHGASNKNLHTRAKNAHWAAVAQHRRAGDHFGSSEYDRAHHGIQAKHHEEMADFHSRFE